jgi:hypothetical protein
LNVKERLFEQKLVEREDEKKGVGQYDWSPLYVYFKIE